MADKKKVAAYKDASLSISSRVDDLLSRMTLAEKAGQLFQNMLPMGPSGTLSEANPTFGILSTEELVVTKNMTHFNLLGVVNNPKEAAQWHNRLQELALTETRLGIPITVSTDPRNHFNDNPGTAFGAGTFSQWPETLGFAALRDESLVEKFGDIARQEYVAMGLRLALHPQIDLATEYRWARIGLTFGESAELSGEMGAAYIRGFQGTGKGDHAADIKQSVSCMAKHFPGGGPQKDGEDPHFVYGKEQVYPGGKFDYHLEPFQAAIDEGTRWMMPYYGQPIGLEGVEEVGFAFNKDIITGLLRDKLRYQGIVCTDWGLVSDGKAILGQDIPARAWGCENLSEVERVVKILDAGCDQFGGESRPDLVIQAVEQTLISESRLDTSVRRLLTEKFELGLFDNPYVDVEAAGQIIGQSSFVEAGLDAQRRSITLLTNKSNTLPLSIDKLSSIPNLEKDNDDSFTIRVYLENIDPDLLNQLNHSLSSSPSTTTQTKIKLTPTQDPSTAHLSLIRLKAPYTPRPGGFESFFHAGSLSFPPATLAHLSTITSQCPLSVIDIYLDRPAILTPLISSSSALTVSYGSSALSFLQTIFNINGAEPQGKLPFDLPRTEEAVQKSREDVPFDTEDPLFKFGFGLRYQKEKEF